MYVLRELWRGEISPTDRRVRQGSEYQQRAAEVRKQIIEFAAILSPEDKERMEAITDLKHSLSMMAEEDMFIYGFRLGARMMLDVMGDYEGQFCSPTEAG